MVAALTSGPSSDLMGAISATSLAGGGFYSAYVGAVVDLAKLMSRLHSGFLPIHSGVLGAQRRQVNLRLNNPPSFRKPMSVIVAALPAVEAAQLPPLRSLNKDGVFCLQKAPLVLPAEGAPVVFSTDIAHDFVLHLQNRAGEALDLPAAPDPSQGGFRSRCARFERRQARSRPQRNGPWILGIRLLRGARVRDGQCAFRRLGDSGRRSGRIDCRQRRHDPRARRHRGLRRRQSASRTTSGTEIKRPGKPPNRMNWRYTFR